ncbi:BTAD domain-containing putative transcriptional regulator [Kitasatospora sp. NPDC004615]|uniref:AfsR/SARP family transcriptional regulator n=1 Tax=Kitasatospora sp. NPDC004615 TaxID=3364017 RepID=UPI0036C72834
MHFGILGPLVISDHSGPRPLPAARQRVLLAALLLRPGFVPSDTLAELVWDGRPPAGAATTLRSYVMRLRRALGPLGPRLETGSGGYRLSITDAELDAHRFVRLYEHGAHEVREGCPGDGLSSLDQALALWRGPALADIACAVLHHEEAVRLSELRLDVRELRVEALLRLGRTGTAVAELRKLTARHPDRERFWALLMTALSRSGRPSEALAVYHRVWRHLADSIGVEPGPELREVHRQILHGGTAVLTWAAS